MQFLEDFQKVLDVNLSAAFKLSKACLRGMMKSRWGRIISITSIVGVTGNAGQTNYAASKAGLIGMSKSLAQEVASRSITVNCLAPGFIITPMTDNFIKYQPISEYPSSYRDISFSITDTGIIKELTNKLSDLKIKYLKKSFMFDFFENKKTNEFKMGFRFIF